MKNRSLIDLTNQKTKLVEIDGLAFTTERLKSMPPKVRNKWRREMRLTMNLIRNSARQNLRKNRKTGASERSVRIGFRRFDVFLKGGSQSVRQVKVNEYGLRHPVFARTRNGDPDNPLVRSQLQKMKIGRRLGAGVFDLDINPIDREGWTWVAAEKRPALHKAVDGHNLAIRRSAIDAINKVTKDLQLD